MTPEKKPRKKYKALYLREVAHREDVQYKLDVARKRIAEINEALSPYGRRALEEQNGGEGPIHFAPLEFVAMRAFIEGNARAADSYDYGTVNYAWRDRSIHKLPAGGR